MWAYSVENVFEKIDVLRQNADLVLNKLKTTDCSNDHYRREYNSLINFIEAGPGSNGQEFLFKMKRTDQHRNQNFMDTHPEIAKAMGY